MRSGGLEIRSAGGVSISDWITHPLVESNRFWRFEREATAEPFMDRLQAWRAGFEAGVWKRLRRLPKCWMLLKRWRSSVSTRSYRNTEICCCLLSRRPRPTGNVCFCATVLRLSWRTLSSTDLNWGNTLCRKRKTRGYKRCERPSVCHYSSSCLDHWQLKRRILGCATQPERCSKDKPPHSGSR